MTKEGWREGAEDSVSHPRYPWKMIEPDIVLTDGQTVTGGDVAIQAFETPGHTMGTASFAFDARDGARVYREDLLKARKPADPHPLVDLPGFRKQLDDLQAGAEKRLVVERQKKAN